MQPLEQAKNPARELGIEAEVAVRSLVLVHHLRRNRPLIVEIDLEGSPAADAVNVVVMTLQNA